MSEAGNAQQRIAFLAEASVQLASSLDFETTLRNVARLAVPAIADWCAVDLVAADGSLRRLAVEHTDPAKTELVNVLQERYPPDPAAKVGVHEVVRTGRPQLSDEIPDALLVEVARDDEHLRMLRSLGLRSYVVAPLAGREGVLGAISLVHAESGRRYSDADLPFIEDLARRAAIAIENARLVRSLEEAKQRLQEQAVALELQAEELQNQATHLEEMQAELELSNTELQEANDALRTQATERQQLLESIERASRAKSDFLATMSHELRTPLNAMIGYTDLLLAGIPVVLPPEAQHKVERIGVSARHLLELIEEILTFSRLEAGEESITLREVDVAALLDEVQALSEPLAVAKGLGFECRMPPTLPGMTSDARKIRQILLNLLGNAIKFTDSGSVVLEAAVHGDRIEFRISDSGVGIARDHLARIFEPFWQAQSGTTRTVGGTGLGLTVTRRLAHLLGGEVSVASDGKHGSVFTASLPLTPPAYPPRPAAATTHDRAATTHD